MVYRTRGCHRQTDCRQRNNKTRQKNVYYINWYDTGRRNDHSSSQSPGPSVEERRKKIPLFLELGFSMERMWKRNERDCSGGGKTKWGIERQVIGQVKQSPARWQMRNGSRFPDCDRDEKAYTHARRLPPGQEMKEATRKRRTPQEKKKEEEKM